MKHLYTIFLALIVCNSYGQGNEFELTDYKYIIPPTPEVASLGKYIETPVNEYTGIPKIGIPIYEIQQGRINHSINLSYHAQGIKVEEIASRVGIGWTLNAGGIVSRQRRSAPDEMPIHGYLNTSETVDNFLNSNLDVSYFSLLYAESNVHEYDFEPDLFTFSFGEYSGKFFFDQVTKEPIFEEASPLKVEWIGYAYFKITTPDGVQYYFGADKDGNPSAKQIKGGDDIMDIYTTGKYEASPSETSTTVLNNPEYVATWYLKEIYDPLSDESLTFEYAEYDLGRLRQRLSSSAFVEYLASGEDVTFEHTLSVQYEKEYVLTQINFNNGNITFVKDVTKRQDLDGSYALKKIEIYTNGDLIKSFGLNHFTTQSTGNYSNTKDLYSFYSGLTDIKYRLFLESFREYAINKVSNTVISSSYKEYDFDYSNPGRLPHRFSTAQDFWGFHNGVTTNKNLLPRDLKSFSDGPGELGQANRQINENYSQDGVLSKITYPTGGTVEYFYENNQAKKDVVLNPVYENSFDPIYYDYGMTPYNFSETNTSFISNGNNPYYEMYFTIDDFESSSLGTTQLIEFDYDNYNPGYPDEPFWDTYIQKVGQTSRYANLNENEDNEISIEPGQYKIVIEWYDGEPGVYNPSINGADDWSISFNVLSETVLSNEDYVLTGGLRVKEIKTNDLEGNINTTKYLYEDENEETTGNLVSLPYRFSDLDYYYVGTVNGTICCPFATITAGLEYVIGEKYSSDSSVPLATTQSSYTGYNKVTEIRETGENGKTEFYFSFNRNTLDMTTLYNYPSLLGAPELAYAIASVPLVNEEIQRGKLLSKIDYNNDGDIVQEITNTYQLITHNVVDAVRPKLLIRGSSTFTFLQGLGIFNLFNDIIHVANKYSLFSRSNLLQESTSIIYDTNGQNPITTTTNYFYDNENVFQPTRIETRNSKNELLKERTYFAHDVNNSQLISEHRIVEPVKKETYNGTTLLTTKETVYNTNHNNEGLYLPEKIQTSLGSGSLQDRVIYHQYNEHGNPTEVGKANGLKIVYIWGYNEQYPIAKIENATFSEVSAQVNVNNIKNLSNSDDDHCLDTGNCSEKVLRNALAALRNLPGALVTTYTYDPLIGITSITDPRGYTIYHNYDEFNRLKSIKDADGNLVEEYEYNYKNN